MTIKHTKKCFFNVSLMAYSIGDGELSQNMNTRVPSESRYALRKSNDSQLQ